MRGGGSWRRKGWRGNGRIIKERQVGQMEKCAEEKKDR